MAGGARSLGRRRGSRFWRRRLRRWAPGWSSFPRKRYLSDLQFFGDADFDAPDGYVERGQGLFDGLFGDGDDAHGALETEGQREERGRVLFGLGFPGAERLLVGAAGLGDGRVYQLQAVRRRAVPEGIGKPTYGTSEKTGVSLLHPYAAIYLVLSHLHQDRHCASQEKTNSYRCPIRSSFSTA